MAAISGSTERETSQILPLNGGKQQRRADAAPKAQEFN